MQQPNLGSAVMLQQPLTKVISCFVAKAHHVHRCAAYLSLIFDVSAQVSKRPSLLNAL